MNCPLRHDIECEDCELHMEVEEEHGYYHTCAIVEIAEQLRQIARVVRKSTG